MGHHRAVTVLALMVYSVAAGHHASPPAAPSDIPCSTLEDFYGDSGTRFQAAIGFYTQEGSPSAPPNTVRAFGIAIDDVVIEWREFRLDADATDCGPGVGSCAVLAIGTTNVFDANALVELSVIDPTPYDPVNDVNDCNGDGDFLDAGVDDQDCNDNGLTDVLVKATSEAEPLGETVTLDRVGSTDAYRASLPISSGYNSVGVLFVSRIGTDQPTVTARYEDRDIDGLMPVAACPNDADPAKRGTVYDATTVFVASGRVAMDSVRVDDDDTPVLDGSVGDGDGFADTNETINVRLTLTNKSGIALDDLVVSVQADPLDNACFDDATKTYAGACDLAAFPATGCAPGRTCRSVIECISRPTVSLASMGTEACAGAPGCRTQETSEAIRFKVGDVSRASVSDALSASFLVTIRSAQFDVLTRRVEFDIPFDLDASGGGSPSAFSEGFEAASGFGLFTSMELDAGKASVSESNGYRCQYNDPSGPNPNDPGRTSCYLGFTTASSNAYDWHIHRNDAANNSTPRAYDGAQSLHWGVHPSTGAKRDSTRFSQLDAIRTTEPIHLAAAMTSAPVLSFKHQISLLDSRSTSTPFGESSDRAVVAIQFADNAGSPTGEWVKIYPYQNEYDVQGTDNFLNCTFDPIDDGNDEDDYFDPSDPYRRLGPSSTCMPEFVFAWHGDTDYRNAPGILTNTGRAFDGPGLAGSVDRGTWVEPRFNLFAYKGRSLRLRFLATSIEVEGAVTVNDTGIGSDNQTGDDGWYIDQVIVTDTVTGPVVLTVDSGDPPGPAGCPNCTSITPSLIAAPATTGAPGQPVELDASASSANVCVEGTLQYQFWDDANGNSVVGDGGDVRLRDWTDNAILRDAPLRTTRYAVIVRCSTAPNCDAASNSTLAVVTVLCPSSGLLPTSYFSGSVTFSDRTTLVFSSQVHDAIRGDLDALRSNGGNFAGTVEACLADDRSGTSLVDPTAPGIGLGFYYVVRPGGGFCNEPKSWSSQASTEAAGRDAEIGADPQTCP